MEIAVVLIYQDLPVQFTQNLKIECTGIVFIWLRIRNSLRKTGYNGKQEAGKK